MLTKEQIMQFSIAVELIIKKRMIMAPIYNKSSLQGDIDQERDVYLLMKMNRGESAYYLYNKFTGVKIIPNGVYLYVNRVDDPLEIYCINHNEINEEKRRLYGEVNFCGHSSITKMNIPINTNLTNDYYKKRKEYATKSLRTGRVYSTENVFCEDVYLAGEIDFSNGDLLFWNVRSGHYLVPSSQVIYNKLPHLDFLLPSHLFVNEYLS